MTDKIKITNIIDFSRDENDPTRYLFSYWTGYDYWDFSFTLINDTISNIIFYDEDDPNRHFVIDGSFKLDDKPKTLSTNDNNYVVEFTDKFFLELIAELSELKTQDIIKENTVECASLPILINTLNNADDTKYYHYAIEDPIITIINKDKLETIVSKQTIKDLLAPLDKNEEEYPVQTDEDGNYLFQTRLVIDLLVHQKKADIKSAIDYAFGPIDFPFTIYKFAIPDELKRKIELDYKNILEHYDTTLLNDIIFCENLFDDDWSEDDDFEDELNIKLNEE